MTLPARLRNIPESLRNYYGTTSQNRLTVGTKLKNLTRQVLADHADVEPRMVSEYVTRGLLKGENLGSGY